MHLDPSSFKKVNVTDTCSIWNIISSKTLYSAALAANCIFCITGFVLYECLFKPRKETIKEDVELQSRLKKEIQAQRISSYRLDLEDLQEIEILEKRKNLGKGELSTIAFAKKTNQAIITDDKKARNLAEQVLDQGYVQTTPHLFGWLFYVGYLADHQKDDIITEHESLKRPLAKFFDEMYNRALEYRLMKKCT